MDEQIRQRIQGLISSQKVFLFMKGTPDEPQCGFSAKVVHLLRENSINFDTFDVLSDESVRQGIKEYANWPTIPQLYVNRKFTGGCDIVTQLH